jgi:hypothetical protein
MDLETTTTEIVRFVRLGLQVFRCLEQRRDEVFFWAAQAVQVLARDNPIAKVCESGT